MKKLFSVLMVSLLALSLAACDDGGGNSKPESSVAVQTTAPPDTSAAPTEAPTEEPTEAPVGVVSDYVYTKVEKSLPSNGSFLLTGETGTQDAMVPNRLPQLKLDSADAQSVNSEIMNNYGELIEQFAASAYEHIQGRIDYVAFLNGKVLSVAIECRSADTPNSRFDVYNFDVTTGSALDKSEVIALSGATEEAVTEALKGEISALYDNVPETGSGGAEVVEDCKSSSLSEEYLSKAQYYYNGEGQLTAAYRYKWMAGAENYGKLAVLSFSIR